MSGYIIGLYECWPNGKEGRNPERYEMNVMYVTSVTYTPRAERVNRLGTQGRLRARLSENRLVREIIIYSSLKHIIFENHVIC